MDFWKNFFEIIQAIITSVGIIVGGIWTYLLFVRQRLGYPKLNLELIIDHVVLPEGLRFVHVEAKLSNVGSIILRSNYAELRLRQVVPLPDEIKSLAQKEIDPVQPGKVEIEWPLIAGREWKWDNDSFEIEPGEPDSLHADYIIPANIQIAEFYCYVSNARKKRQGIGWTLTKIYEFKEKKKMLESEKANSGKTRNNQSDQQRQQKPQPPQQQTQPQKPKK